MKIAIAGYGIEGAASYRYWSRLSNDVTILDERTELALAPSMDSQVVLGADAFSNLEQYDLVIRTAGLSPHRLTSARKVWSATNEFFERCPAPIIGVTGTKGKGTTSSMIVSILRAGDKIVHLVGNIGTPALDVLPSIKPNDIVVFELSSFQLWDLESSPHIAVVLMIEPDHLDVHAGFADYVAAKANIVAYQTSQDTVVYNKNNSFSTEIGLTSQAKKVLYPYYIGTLAKHVRVPGDHNLENAAAAIAAVAEYTQDETTISQGLESFTGLEHRLKLIACKDDVRYYDDSISTTPGSAIAALRSFPEQPKIILLGGSNKGASYEELVAECSIANVYVIATGDTGKQIINLCRESNVSSEYVDGDMNALVERSRTLAKPGSVVILSPASASFDRYKNYAQRGDKFIDEVLQL